ncbi:MAG TPA: EAL domain-containing protein [Micromonosporaceae bacterium]|nr:EAL domain-containing protein [Micromonosporaceae bacterium]
MSFHWSTHQLSEYFAAVSASADEEMAIRVAVERAVEALDAEVGATVVDGVDDLCGLVGVPARLPASIVDPAAEGKPTLDFPGLGPAFAGYAELGSGVGGGLLVARFDEGFAAEERQMLQGMAQVLGLALRNLRTLAVERGLREEREREAVHRLRLLEEVRARQALLETLLAIQRAISHREPLQSVLDAISEGASNLLGRAAIALVLSDPADPANLIMASTAHWPAAPEAAAGALEAAAVSMAAGHTVSHGCDSSAQVLRAAPVHVNGAVAGSLISILTDVQQPSEDPTDLLSAFAQQISMALTDARTVEAMREAYRDPLTGLPNRKLFLDRLENALRDPGTWPLAVLFIDLDRFKSVNDCMGHRAGDELLASVTGRLRGCLRGSDVAARLGGDEFAVLLENATEADGRWVAERIAQEVAEPFQISGRTVYVGSSIGIAVCPAGTVDAAELLSNADVAMYRAKKSSAGPVVVFEPAMHAEAVTRLEFQVDLKNALSSSQFRLNYQPLNHLASGRIHGVEALLRWRHPGRGEVLPGDFIPLAEEIGLINDVGRWVLGNGVRDLADWRRLAPDLTLNVNVSSREIVDRGFVDGVIGALEAAGLPGAALTIELTETALMSDPATALRHLHTLKNAGVRVSVDDFGTGYSSLSYLRQFPVDQVKIDRAFVAGLSRSDEDRAVVTAIIELARALCLQVVAEGIEDAAQLRTLRRLGCDLGQGYYLHRPMERDLCDKLIRDAGRGL